MEPDERPRALPEVTDVVRRHGHSGGVEVPRPQGEPRDVVRPRCPDPPPQPPPTTGTPQPAAATRRPRRRTPRRGSRVAGLLVLLGAGALFFGSGESTGGSMILSSNEVEVVVHGVGDLDIRTGSPDVLGYSATSGPGGHCQVIPGEATSGQPLRVDVTCEAGLGGNDVELDVPSTTRLTVGVDDADVRAKGQLAALTVRSGRGDVRVEKFTGDVAVRATEGDVRLDKVTGAIWVDAEADVRADVSASRDVRVRSGGGDVRLTYRGQVPTTTVDAAKDVKVELASGPAQLDLQSRGGDIDTELQNTPGAAQRVTVRSDGGDIDVKD